jgi:hypothetical protein
VVDPAIADRAAARAAARSQFADRPLELGEEEQRSTGRGQEFKKRRRLSEGQLVKQRIQLARRCVDSVLSPHDEAGQPGLLRRTRVEGGTRDGPAAQCVRAHVASSSG